MATFITSLILYGFMAGVLGFIGKLIYDIQQSKKQDGELENDFEAKDKFQKLAGIKPTNPNDELREILVKNNILAKEQIVGALLKAAQNSEFPAPDESINVRTEKITTIDTNFPSDKDPLESVPMSRVSKEAKQKMAEIAKEDISKQLEQNTEKFAALFPNEADLNDQRLGVEFVKPKRKYTKKKTK